MGLIGNSNLSFIRAEEGNKVEILMLHVIMIEAIIKIDNVDLAYLALAVRSTKMICLGLLLWMAGNSCGHGTGWPQM